MAFSKLTRCAGRCVHPSHRSVARLCVATQHCFPDSMFIVTRGLHVRTRLLASALVVVLAAVWALGAHAAETTGSLATSSTKVYAVHAALIGTSAANSGVSVTGRNQRLPRIPGVLPVIGCAVALLLAAWTKRESPVQPSFLLFLAFSRQGRAPPQYC